MQTRCRSTTCLCAVGLPAPVLIHMSFLHHVYTSASTHDHALFHVHANLYGNARAHTLASMRMPAHIYAHACAHVYTYVCTHVHTHVHTHVYTQATSSSLPAIYRSPRRATTRWINDAVGGCAIYNNAVQRRVIY